MPYPTSEVNEMKHYETKMSEPTSEPNQMKPTERKMKCYHIMTRDCVHPRRRIFTDVGTISKTKQEFKDECDVNNILARYQKTGIIEHSTRYPGSYQNLSEPLDFQTAQNKIIEAQNAFYSLPSSLRARFNNEPANFLDFVHDKNNLEEMQKLGLAKPPTITQEEPKKRPLNPNPPKPTQGKGGEPGAVGEE